MHLFYADKTHIAAKKDIKNSKNPLKMNSQILVVGAGFSGASVARKLAEQGEDVLVMDRLGHIAGAAYDEKIKTA